MNQHPHDTAADTAADTTADTTDGARDDERVATRSELLPEEQAAGSDDPRAQAEAILSESDERTERPEGTRDESTQTPDQQNPNEPV